MADRIRSGTRGVVMLGASVLWGCAAPAASPTLLTPPLLSEPTLDLGDQLRITVWNAPEFSGDYLVTADSTLAHPLLQAVKVAGLPISVIKLRLIQFLRTYLQDPQVVLEPLFPVSVGGAVLAPGLYTFTQEMTLLRAIAEAGGPADNGRLDRVRLIRGGSDVMIDLVSNLQYGASPIMSGDRLIVGSSSGFNVFRDFVTPVSSVAAMTILFIRLVQGR